MSMNGVKLISRFPNSWSLNFLKCFNVRFMLESNGVKLDVVFYSESAFKSVMDSIAR